MHQEHPNGLQMPTRFGTGGLDEAYERCGVVTASYAKTFYLGTQLMTPEKAKAVWAVYVWCRRTDELVDGPNASRITPEVLTTYIHFQQPLLHNNKCTLCFAQGMMHVVKCQRKSDVSLQQRSHSKLANVSFGCEDSAPASSPCVLQDIYKHLA